MKPVQCPFCGTTWQRDAGTDPFSTHPYSDTCRLSGTAYANSFWDLRPLITLAELKRPETPGDAVAAVADLLTPFDNRTAERVLASVATLAGLKQ